METIPSVINGVTVHFGSAVHKDVSVTMINGLKHCIRPAVAAGYVLSNIYISSAHDQHVMPSRHAQHKGVDISRINGMKIGVGYPGVPAIKAIVDAIQTTFETFVGRRENYGPFFKKKLGQPHNVAGHNDHIHLSVN
jgi:hypothetical protein